jgi:ribosomal protein L24
MLIRACLIGRSSDKVYLRSGALSGKPGCPSGRVADHVGSIERIVIEGVLIAALPGQGPRHSIMTLIFKEGVVVVSKIGFLVGPVCPSEIMRQSEGGI